MTDARLNDEPARLAALDRYDILDTPAEPAFDRITALVRSILAVPVSVVSLVDAKRQWFKSHDGIAADQTPRDIAFCDYTIRQPGPMVIADATADPRFSGNPLVTGAPHIRSYAGVPLCTPDGYQIGSLCAIDTVPRDFDSGQIAILENLAGLVVEQLELRRIAERDHLSGALTRRAFIAEMDKRIALYARHGRPAGLLLFDIDHFKRVNDTHGHPAGDQVIRAVVDLCNDLKRPSDTIGRLGGEEFGLLLPEAGDVDALQAAGRFRAAIEARVIDHDPPLRVTASFGVAVTGDRCMNSNAWLATADIALYAAKRGGRNRVASAHAPVQDAA